MIVPLNMANPQVHFRIFQGDTSGCRVIELIGVYKSIVSGPQTSRLGDQQLQVVACPGGGTASQSVIKLLKISIKRRVLS